MNNTETAEKHVLDKGWVKLVDHLGDDHRIVEAALMSTRKEGVKDEAEFIARLLKAGHTSPFEQVVFTFDVKCPIFVARQMMRHRTARTNELSLRYTDSELEFYVPADDRLGDHPDTARGYVETFYTQAAGCYKTMCVTHVPREVARVVLPLSTYTRFMWQMDLHNLLHFLTLRCEKAAQWETRQYALAIKELASGVCPMAFAAWEALDKSAGGNES